MKTVLFYQKKYCTCRERGGSENEAFPQGHRRASKFICLMIKAEFEHSNNMQVKVYAGNNRTLINYISLKVRKSIDEMCHTAEITCPLTELKKVKKHDIINIKMVMWNKDERNVTTTLIDDISATLATGGTQCGQTPQSSNNSQKQMTIMSRSFARDIIDSSDSGRVEGGTLVEVVKKIAQKYNPKIDVSHYRTDIDLSPQITSFTWENESVWQKLLTVAENNGYSIASNQASGLYVWEKKQYLSGIQNHALVEGVNIKSASLNKRGFEQFNCYRIKGNYAVSEKNDSSCDTKRVFTLFFTDENISAAELERRALSEIARRKTDELSISVHGWGMHEKEIEKLKIKNKSMQEVFYEPKQPILVKLPSFGLENEIKIIKSVELILSNNEYSANLVLVNKGAI